MIVTSIRQRSNGGTIAACLQEAEKQKSFLPNAETAKAIEDARNGVGLSRGFTSVSELMEDLDTDG